MSANLCERVAGVALLSAALLVVPAAGAAQGPPGGGGDKVKVTLNQNVVTFPMPGVTEFDAGWVDATGIVVSVQPRKNQTGPWELRIRTDDLDMGGYGKPIADILWRPAGSTSWAPLTNTDQMVLQGTGTQDVTVFLRLRLDYAFDIPNTYSADIEFNARMI